MKQILILGTLLTLCFSVFSFKAQSANISGEVKNEKGKLLSHVAVLLLQSKDSSLVKGDYTNEAGVFKFENIENGTYLISVSSIGFQKYYSEPMIVTANDLQKNITLNNADKALREVKVIGKKPMIEVKADKTVFNVEQSINATGSNALDLLRKSPGVRVDKDENIEMRGKNNVLVYIDGKPTYMGTKDLAAMLKNLQSSDIESIELISNPSAKYDASGNAGIINIKLKKNKKFGTNGSLNLGVAQGKYFKQNAALNLNHRNKDVNVFGNYSFNQGKNFNFQNFDRTQNAQQYDFKSENVNQNAVHNIKVGADYYINKKNVIGVMANLMINQGNFSSSSKTDINALGGNIDKRLIANNTIAGNSLNGGINLNYKYEDTSGRSFNIDVDYGNFNSQNKSYQPNTYWNPTETNIISQSIYRNFTPTIINIYTAKSDYEQNFLKGKLGIGVKTAYVKTDNDFQFFDVVNNEDTLNLNRSNHFVYIENVNAGYINYSRAFGEKLSTQLGLRVEQTNSKGQLSSAFPQNDDTVNRYYINLFPSAGFSYNINANHSLGITYSRRIDRPNYQDLNPFENKLDELTYEKGNAFLRPQYTNSIDLTHTFKQYFTTSLSFSRVIDMFMQTTDTTEFSRTYVTQKNFASKDLAGINISFPAPIKKWWMIYFNLNANYNKLQANFEGRKLSNTYYTYTVYADNNFTLPKDFSLNITGWYTGPNYWGGTFKMKPMGSLDLGLQKLFLNKKLSAKISLSDVFKTQRWYAISNFSGLYVDANGNYESRQLRLNLTYRFGRNEIAKRRERESGAEKESERIKGK